MTRLRQLVPDIPFRRLVRVLGLPELVLNLAALAAVASAVLAWSTTWTVGLLGFTWLAIVFAGGDAVDRAGAAMAQARYYVLARFALVSAALVWAWRQELATQVMVGGLLFGLAILFEPFIRLLAAQAFPYAWGFAGVKARAKPWISGRLVFVVNWLMLGVFLLEVLGQWWPAVTIWAGVLGLTVTLAGVVDAVIFVVQRLVFNAHLPGLLRDLAPTFALHWEAPPGSLYQVSMWLDQLGRLGKPFMLITRTTDNFHEAKALGVPVLHRVGLESVGDALTDSLKTVFYVNTATRNDHLLRYPQLNHIQLNHGDSDKIASYSPVFRSYDKNFVAGQAAIDRFEAAGLATAPGFFVVVGRPQVAAVALAAGPIAAVSEPTVLYAPTWVGNTADSNYTSLPWGPQIVQALLDRGCSVIFRPHPYWARHHRTRQARDAVLAMLQRDQGVSGRRHVFGEAAEKGLDVVDCFNQSDAMISDVSSVVGDYLFSEKPFVMMAVGSPVEQFQAANPVARAAYVVDAGTLVNPAAGGEGSLGQALDAMLGPDPLAAKRHEFKVYYLGDIPPANYADRFHQEASRYV